MLCFLAGMVDDHGNHIGQEEHAEALGRDVLGRSGGDLMVRMVQPRTASYVEEPGRNREPETCLAGPARRRCS